MCLLCVSMSGSRRSILWCQYPVTQLCAVWQWTMRQEPGSSDSHRCLVRSIADGRHASPCQRLWCASPRDSRRHRNYPYVRDGILVSTTAGHPLKEHLIQLRGRMPTFVVEGSVALAHMSEREAGREVVHHRERSES